CLCFCRRPRLPRVPLFPSTTLFRSLARALADRAVATTPDLDAEDLLSRVVLDGRGPPVEAIRTRPLTDKFGSVVSGLMALDADRDRKSTRLNSSHVKISYAVFRLKK